VFRDLANWDGWTYISRPDSTMAAMAEKMAVRFSAIAAVRFLMLDGCNEADC
jgi:hypothetical protein